jgi:hypothetical protein
MLIPCSDPPPVPDRVQTGQVLLPGLLVGFAINALIDRWPWWVAVLLVLSAIPLPKGLAALSRYLQRRRYGVSVLHIDALPLQPGQLVRGAIEIPRAISGMAPARLSLQCLEDGLLSLNADVTAHPRTESHSTWLPFEVKVPAGPPSDPPRIRWRIHVGACTGLIDYQEAFEVEVTDGAEPHART